MNEQQPDHAQTAEEASTSSGWYVLCLTWLIYGVAFVIFSKFLVKPAVDVTNQQMIRLGTEYSAYAGFVFGLLTFLLTGAVYLIARLFSRKFRFVIACALSCLGYGVWMAFGYNLVYVEPRYTEIARSIITYLGTPMLYAAATTIGIAIIGIITSTLLSAFKRAK